MKNYNCIMVALILFIATTIHASDKNDWPSGGAMHTGLIFNDKKEEIMDKLRKKHLELVELISIKKGQYLVDPSLVKAVQEQQLAWEEYMVKECELIGSLNQGASSWQSAAAGRCQYNLTMQRYKRTRDAVNCIERIAPEDRWYYMQSCIYQTAPLAIPLKNDS